MGLLFAAVTGLLPAPPAPSNGAGGPAALGRFTDYIVALVTVAVIAAALVSHLGIIGTPDTFLDAVALVAVGVIYGTARGISAGNAATTAALSDRANLNTALAEAAHRRLDTMGAPPAPLDSTGLAVGRPTPE